MATNSFLKSIYIRDKHSAEKLINALEHSGKKKSQDVKFTKSIHEVKPADILKILGE